MSDGFLVKEEVILRGTSHDPRGMITLTAEPEGVNINKSTDNESGDITLTVKEIKGILEAIEDNFNMRDDV